MSRVNDHETGGFDPRDIALPAVDARRASANVDWRVEVGAHTDRGRTRPNNEDHFLAARLARCFEVITTNLPPGKVPERVEQEAYALAVADGMGGAAAGEVASALALTLGAEMTLGTARWPLHIDEHETDVLIDRVRRYFEDIDRLVSERARTLPGLAGMGTTLTVAYLVGGDLFVFHVGDSRAYLLRDGDLRQLTRDHTVAQALLEAGAISPEQVATHHLRHVLTYAIGAGEPRTPATIGHVQVRPGDRLLLCTDGLSDLVDAAAISRVLGAAAGAQAAAEQLVALALEAGGHDNVTVVVADLRDE